MFKSFKIKGFKVNCYNCLNRQIDYSIRSIHGKFQLKFLKVLYNCRKSIIYNAAVNRNN